MPDFSAALTKIGAAYKDKGDFNQAAVYFLKALTIQPDCLETNFNLAVTYHLQKNFDAALSRYLQTIRIKPDFAVTYTYLAGLHQDMGAAYKDQGDLDQAAIYFLKALAIQPDCLEANFNLAVMYHLQNNFTAALSYYQEAIRIKPDFAEAHKNIVALYDDAKNPELVLTSLQKIRELNPRIDTVGPRRIRIETSSACNLRCQHCPTGTNYSATTRNIMEMEMFDDILRQLKAMPILRDIVFYLGGEPLLNKNLPLMCRRVKEETQVTETQFNTNGMLITEELCRQLAAAKIDKIWVSIDGTSPEENDEIRRGSRYKTIVANVHLLINRLPDTKVFIANTIFKRQDDPDEAVTPVFIKRDFPGVCVETTYAMKWPALDTDKSAVAQKGGEAGLQVDNFCKMPFTEMAVRPNGDVVMCCYDLAGEMVMGNIQESGLLDIWLSQPYKKIRENILSRKIDLLPDICKRCQFYCGAIPLIRKS